MPNVESKPFFSWVGGKRRLAEEILKDFPPHLCYVEPFCGGAALFFMKDPTKVEVINDSNGDLINLFRVVKCHFKEFIRQFEWSLVSRDIYDEYNNHRDDDLTDIQRAARFYYLLQLSFGGNISTPHFGTATVSPPKLNLNDIEHKLTRSHARLSRAFIEHIDWQDCFKKYDRPHTLFYLDPPYWQTAGYGVDFAFDQYEAIVQYFESAQGRIILSINDHPDIRSLFADFVMREVEVKYTMGGNHDPKTATELIVTSRRISDQQDVWYQTPWMSDLDYGPQQISLIF